MEEIVCNGDDFILNALFDFKSCKVTLCNVK